MVEGLKNLSQGQQPFGMLVKSNVIVIDSFSDHSLTANFESRAESQGSHSRNNIRQWLQVHGARVKQLPQTVLLQACD
jgi:hypothetical protein